MIEQASFKNFKNLRDVVINFQTPLTVLVGPNASGKTSILEGLAFVTSLGPSDGRRRLSCHQEWAGRGGEGYILEASAKVRNQDSYVISLSVVDEIFSVNAKFRENDYTLDATSVSDLDKQINAIARVSNLRLHLLPRVNLIRLEGPKLAAASIAEGSVATIGANGQGLASALADMASGEPARFAMLQDLLRSVVPAVRWVKVKRRQVPLAAPEMMPSSQVSVWGHKIFFDMGKSEEIPAELVSEGTLLTLGILAIIEQTDSNGRNGALLLVDDLDRGLHPKAQREMVAALRKLIEQKPNLQIIATSHSPYLLDCLKPEEVCMTALAEDGSALCGSLTEHPDFPRWKDVMLPGEFWSSVGEDWLRKVRSRPDA